MRPMASPNWKILVAEPYSPQALARLQAAGTVHQLSDCSEQALCNAVPGCQALLVRTSSQVTRKVIAAGNSLKVIGRGGVGLDNIDIDAAQAHGVSVVYTPNAATESVADLTFSLILGLTWKLTVVNRAIREDGFANARTLLGARELNGLVLGIIGLGRIGQAVARRATAGFHMNVMYDDLYEISEAARFGAHRVERNRLLESADIVSLHVPLTPKTRHMISTNELGRMKTGSLLINTSRGAVVDLNALAAGLQKGTPAAAGLDVFEPEPPPSGHPILAAPNTLFTPHAGARTALAQDRMNAVVEDVLNVLEGRPPCFPAF